jgi:hypothetical protein
MHDEFKADRFYTQSYRMRCMHALTRFYWRRHAAGTRSSDVGVGTAAWPPRATGPARSDPTAPAVRQPCFACMVAERMYA